MNSSGLTAWGPEVIRLEGQMLVVGRSSSADVRLLHPAISRCHAQLQLQDGKVVVRDLGSHFGTKINGQRIREQCLQQGDRVEFGPIVYRFLGQLLRIQEQTKGIHLETQGLAIARGGQQILRGVNLCVLPGQFVGILGPSGCGKTSLIKCFAGFVPQQAGRLSFDGLDLVANLDSYRQISGYVPQEDLLYGQLTGRENLAFALWLRTCMDHRSAERADIVAQTLARLHLSEHADKPVAVLSGGQRKRFNVAMELLAQPRILFLDEPTSGLDPAAETRLMGVLKKEAARGTTVVCATHVMENLALFDSVVVLGAGTAVYAGTPKDLLPHFRMPTYIALYESLENQGPRQFPPESALTPPENPPFVASGVLQGLPLVKTTAQAAKTISPIALATQVQVQFLRGLRLIIKDKLLLVMLVSQPVLIGLLINLSQIHPEGLSLTFMFTVLTSIWLGLNNTAREAVRDRQLYVRERMAGVTPEGYLCAKLLLFGAVGFFQLLLLTFMLHYANFLSAIDREKLASRGFIYLLLVLWTTYIAAMLLGLLVSTLANTQETAIAALPLIILPQMLLTGVVTGLESVRNGTFSSLVLLIARANEAPKGMLDWILELVSLLTYTRPSLALLQRVRPDESPVPVGILTVVDWLHLLFLILLTATGLVLAFYRCEKRWLEQA